MRFSTRPAKSGDEELLYQLIRELAEKEGKEIASLPVTKEKLSLFGFGEKSYFSTELAECEGKVVGYALYYYGFSANQGHPILYLEDRYVQTTYRKLGIGTQLLKQLNLYANQKKCCRMEWHVFDWNEEAKNFYQKIGGILRKDLTQVRLEIKR